jgi:hypothetical protein
MQSKFCQTLGDAFFSPPHLVFRVGKLKQMAKKKCQTVGDDKFF